MNRFWGGVLLVSGTTIGGGMLALPLSAFMGFWPSVGILFISWMFMVSMAFIAVDINIRFGRAASVSLLASHTIGPWGMRVARFALLWLFYALLGAYISGASALLSSFCALSEGTLALVFTGILGSAIVVCIRSADYINRLLFIIKIICLGCVLYALFPFIKPVHLSWTVSSMGAYLVMIPVAFTSFGFHGSIPTLVTYVGMDRKRLRHIFLLGTGISFVVFVMWQACAMGVLPKADIQAMHSLDNIVYYCTKRVPGIDVSMHLFTLLAIATSFVGVSLGLLDFMKETGKHKHSQAIYTFIPPLAFSLVYPKGFVLALGFASVALAVLAVFIPITVAYKMKGILSKYGIYVALLLGLVVVLSECIYVFMR